jgi:hypothetical protein
MLAHDEILRPTGKRQARPAMQFEPGSTVLVMCTDEDYAAELLGQLYDAGVDAVGPVTTAEVALLRAAQTGPTDALLIGPTTGEYDVQELAEVLTRTWGVRCVILPSRRTPVS